MPVWEKLVLFWNSEQFTGWRWKTPPPPPTLGMNRIKAVAQSLVSSPKKGTALPRKSMDYNPGFIPGPHVCQASALPLSSLDRREPNENLWEKFQNLLISMFIRTKRYQTKAENLPWVKVKKMFFSMFHIGRNSSNHYLQHKTFLLASFVTKYFVNLIFQPQVRNLCWYYQEASISCFHY